MSVPLISVGLAEAVPVQAPAVLLHRRGGDILMISLYQVGMIPHSVTEDEYRRLFCGETILMRGFRSAKYGDFDAMVSLTGYQDAKTDARTGKPAYWGAYEVERQF